MTINFRNCQQRSETHFVMTAKAELSDVELLELMKAGNEEGLSALYRRQSRAVHRFAWQMCGSQAVADDVTQEVFMALIRESNNYDPTKGTLHGFLLGVARNHVLRRLRRERVYVSIEENAAEQKAGGNGPLEDFSRSEMIESVRGAILTLPERYREVVVLCDLEELSYQEAAAVLECAVGTVRSRLHRARALLIGKLRPSTEHESTEVKSARCFA
jgi:RNA polymerase sigma-70 factor (ECF subfamily)